MGGSDAKPGGNETETDMCAKKLDGNEVKIDVYICGLDRRYEAEVDGYVRSRRVLNTNKRAFMTKNCIRGKTRDGCERERVTC